MNYIRLRVQEVIDFLSPFLPLVNSHMVEFFSDHLWENYVPSCLKLEFENEYKRHENIVHLFSSSILDSTNLGIFLQKCGEMSVDLHGDVIISLDHLQEKLSKWGYKNYRTIVYDKFMSDKKQHEVQIMSGLVAALASMDTFSHIVDIGDGKGYLSSMLSLEYSLNVLGLDSSEVKTQGAALRTQKLQKQWRGTRKSTLSKNIANEDEQNVDGCNNSVQGSLYRQQTLFVSESTHLPSILKELFLVDIDTKFGLIGLHTCGGLSPVSISQFLNTKQAQFLVNIGCCYHLLEDLTSSDPSKCTFPLSDYLREQRYVLSRNARMLSLQAPSRIYSLEKIPSSIFFRAVFEMFIQMKFGNSISNKEVGRIGSKCATFTEYVHKVFDKWGINIDLSDTEIEAFYDSYAVFQAKLEFYYMLRAVLAPIIENIILLDRLLYLREKGVDDSYLVRLFDPIISPRCYGIVAVKPWKTEHLLPSSPPKYETSMKIVD